MESVRAYLDTFKRERDFKSAIRLLLQQPDFRMALFAEIPANVYPYSEYASWIAQHFYAAHPELFPESAASFREILLTISNPTIQRNLTHIFGEVKLPLEEDGVFLELLFRFLKSPESAPALKLQSYKSIGLQYVHTYPELISEMKTILDLHHEDQRPSVQSIIRHFYKRYSAQLDTHL